MRSTEADRESPAIGHRAAESLHHARPAPCRGQGRLAGARGRRRGMPFCPLSFLSAPSISVGSAAVSGWEGRSGRRRSRVWHGDWCGEGGAEADPGVV
jgi:hypothetical protein